MEASNSGPALVFHFLDAGKNQHRCTGSCASDSNDSLSWGEYPRSCFQTCSESCGQPGAGSDAGNERAVRKCERKLIGCNETDEII